MSSMCKWRSEIIILNSETLLFFYYSSDIGRINVIETKGFKEKEKQSSTATLRSI